jgi:hypothetical protein
LQQPKERADEQQQVARLFPDWLDRPSARGAGPRRFTFALAASRGWADSFNVPTRPVFARIDPPALQPVTPRVATFPLTQARLLGRPYLDAQRWKVSATALRKV